MIIQSLRLLSDKQMALDKAFTFPFVYKNNKFVSLPHRFVLFIYFIQNVKQDLYLVLVRPDVLDPVADLLGNDETCRSHQRHIIGMGELCDYI